MKITKDHLELLSKSYKNINEVSREIINLESILSLPKGTEHFISDIHGEFEAFDHILRNGSGVIKEKLKEIFDKRLTTKEINLLATTIYYPEEKLELIKKNINKKEYIEFKKILILRLLEVTRMAARKYTRSKVRKILPTSFSYVIEELLYKMDITKDKTNYYDAILDCIIELEKAEDFIKELSFIIQRLVVNHLHIVGDIYDRGPFPDKIMDRLISYHSVDIQWGNHDMLWIGASCGDLICIANVLRICARYDNLDIVEDRYGISLRGLLNLSDHFYKDDDCLEFIPKLSNQNKAKYSEFELKQIARMHKAISIIQFKLEKQAIKRNPDFNLHRRLLLDKIDYNNGTININNKIYKLTSCNFPTIDKKDVYKLTKEEETLILKIRKLFVSSEKLRKHIDFILNNGSMYKCYNENLLLHGCMPSDEKGNFQSFIYKNKKYSGKNMLDFFDEKVRRAFYSKQNIGDDIFFYLWQGEYSPLFGKKDMTTFERYFISDKEAHIEEKNKYYELRDNVDYCNKLLLEFGLDPSGHIINGHTPVKAKKGEDPIKAAGRTIVIDGGMSRAYHNTTGHGGYTLTYNSYGLQIMKHNIFSSKEQSIKEETDIVSTKRVVDEILVRKTIKDTDIGKNIIKEILQLKRLLKEYKTGKIREKF
ncbi:fructose-1,6-bisphosphatase [Gemelliphila palaticanis]|uniref:Fructose-1,6-bisphosphatase class 3 n=1 Tax=Gemelliphila palaticanis TaxID=81950 RepID=A0ABX2SY04_9BACL|nr:fructose-1,6-bisphosphatase [Gemella palaticanis]MBF0715232.1 fructose-1,6-bisphosphatase [Gemella palaticanis]NYS47162.1 fructose-1,6-bisphosphatase [Gemella palaticanis]